MLALLGGLMTANGIPHFIKGIVREEYPCVLGNSPVRNLVAGWAALVLGGLLLHLSDIPEHGPLSLGSEAVGVLAMGLFHALGGAFRLNSLLGRANPVGRPG